MPTSGDETEAFPGPGHNVGFERIRRITGYLVGTMDKWNDGKRSEEADRVRHDSNVSAEQRVSRFAARPGTPPEERN